MCSTQLRPSLAAYLHLSIHDALNMETYVRLLRLHLWTCSRAREVKYGLVGAQASRVPKGKTGRRLHNDQRSSQTPGRLTRPLSKPPRISPLDTTQLLLDQPTL